MRAFLRIALRWALRAVAVAAVLYTGFFAYMYWLMTRPPEQFASAMSKLAMPVFILLPFESMWFKARAGSLGVGDPAPDFQLPTLDRTASVTLSSFRGVRPVALIFGSYT